MPEVRILVACRACARSYDASSYVPGSHFRCFCGVVLDVPEAAPRPATMLSCTHCGGAIPAGATTCPYCRSSLAPHEQERRTTCPACTAWIPDDALFCPECGRSVPGRPLDAALTASDRICPQCRGATRLNHRRFGEGHAALECPACVGLWLPHEIFDQVLAQARHAVAATGARRPTRTHIRNRDQQAGPLYRPCPLCSQLMNRKNYAHASGVVVDICKDHGLWFDRDELATILRWVEEGGEAVADERRREEARRRASTPTSIPKPVLMDLPTTAGHDPGNEDPLGDLLEAGIGALLTWFKKR